MRKPKFKPQIARVKLNPEQAVLSCNCYSGGLRYWTLGGYSGYMACWGGRVVKTCGEAHANAAIS